MSEVEIFTSCAERLRSLAIPSELENVAVIRTPFLLDGDFILLGKRHQGHLIALFPNQKAGMSIPGNDLKLSNGFKVAILELQDPDTGKPSPFLELCNMGNIDEILFGALLDELLKNIDAGIGDIVQQIKDLLEKWKSMLSLDSERVLSMNAIVGLFGELALLDYLVNDKNRNDFGNWVGPLGNRHDFEFEKNSIEVKSTTLKNNNEIKVHGVHQLEAYPGKSVYILRVKLELDPHGTSLPSLIDKISESPLVSREKLFDKLLKSGYKNEHLDSYRFLCFQPIEFHLVPVDGNFPQISAKELLKIDPADRINQIEYSVNISGLASKIGTCIADLNLEEVYE
jgi:hypothetical protein